MKLIISEKAIAGKNIASILAGSDVKESRVGTAPVFRFSYGGTDAVVVPLRGHITDVEFPKKYSYWVGTDLRKLVNAEIEYAGTEPAIISALKQVGKDAAEIIVATDADREGESIGVEALNYIREVNVSAKIKRAYFSAITKKDLSDAFSKLVDVDYNFADSADSRREIDLIWGAVLTRFLSLVSGKLGQDYLSVGRVQSPSVDYSEDIFIKGPDGLFGVEKIGRFVEENSIELERIIGSCEVFSAKCGFEALCFNPGTLRLEFKPITHVVRHRHLGSLLDIRLETGRRVKITGSHSVFVVRDSKIQVLLGEELREGDVLLAPKNFNVPEMSQIDILGMLQKHSFAEGKIFVYGAQNKKFIRLTGAGRKWLRSRRKETGLIVYKTRFRSSTISGWETGKGKEANYGLLCDYLQALGSNIDFFISSAFGSVAPLKRQILNIKHVHNNSLISDGAVLGCSDRRWVLPLRLPVTREFARLLGYYLAEGSTVTRGCVLDFGHHETELVNDAAFCVNNVFHRAPSIKKKRTSIQVAFGGTLFTRFLRDALQIGGNARNKRVPKVVFSFPRDMKLEFLRGYYEGDGNYSTSGQLVCSTASEKLASDIVYLLSSLGVVATMGRHINNSPLPSGKSKHNPRISYTVKVSGKNNLGLMERAVPIRHLERLNKYLANGISRCGFDGIPIKETGLHEIWLDLPRHYAQRLSAQKLAALVQSTNKKLGQQTVLGLNLLAQSDLLFLRINKISLCKPSTDFVYDISVKDNESFVGGAGGIILHNTLALIVNREKERLAFQSKMYWELLATFEKDAKKFTAEHKKGKFWEKEGPEAISRQSHDFGTVAEIKSQKRVLKKPTPFNTTDFLRAATTIGFSAGQAMDIAERLYQEGYTSYPRTDNTVYPQSLEISAVLGEVAKATEFKKDCEILLGKKELLPSRGKKETKDHPPIYPVSAALRSKLSDRDWKVYELIVRRFFATLADDAITENQSVELLVGDEPFIARGQKILDAGWKAFYPYSEISEVLLPHLSKGERVKLLKMDFLEKETQPPSRYSQSTLIKLMEDLGIGTKSTRHTIIQKLYNRKYIAGNKAVEPNKIAFAVVDSLEKHKVDAVKHEMTALLEKEMDKIAAGKRKKSEVVGESRKMLMTILERMIENKDAIGSELRLALRGDSLVGKCDKCDGQLRTLISKNRKRFLGCTNYPKCTNTYPLPQKGKIQPLGTVCDKCGTPKIKVIGQRYRFEMCVNPGCVTKAEWKSKAAAKAASQQDGKVAAGSAAVKGAKEEEKIL